MDASPVLRINDEVFSFPRWISPLTIHTHGQRWDAFVGDVFYSGPVVDQNGRTYVIGYTGGGENHLFAFDSDGTKAWDTNDTECPFEIGGIGCILSSKFRRSYYYGCYDNRIYCIDVGVASASSDWPMFQRSGRRDGAWPSISLKPQFLRLELHRLAEQVYNEGATATVIAQYPKGILSVNGLVGLQVAKIR